MNAVDDYIIFYILKAYREFGKSVCSENTEELMAEPIFCHDNIKFGNRTVFYKSWIEQDIYNTGNTMCANGNFLSFEQFKDRYKVNIDCNTYTGCRQRMRLTSR